MQAKITEGLEAPGYVHVVREDPVRRGLLFAGTETGIFVSFDMGKDWKPLQLDLPTSSVRDITVKNADLIVATHGRGFYALDDINPLRKMTRRRARKNVVLMKPLNAVRYRGGQSFKTTGNSIGSNPPDGVIIDYYLKSKARNPVTLKVFDGKGHLVAQFSTAQARKQGKGLMPFMAQMVKHGHVYPLSNHQGVNRFVWNMRYPLVPAIPGAVYVERPPLGVMAPPGKYVAELTVNGKHYKKSFSLLKDPRSTASIEELDKQFKLEMKVQYLMGVDHAAANRIIDIRKRLDAVAEHAKSKQLRKISKKTQKINAALGSIENHLYQSKAKTFEELMNHPVRLNARISNLKFKIGFSDTAPAKQLYLEYKVYRKHLKSLVQKWRKLYKQQIPALNKRLEKVGIKAVHAGDTKDERIPMWLRPFKDGVEFDRG